MAQLNKVTDTKTIKELVKMQDHLRFDLAIQRNLVWDKEKKSLFIHSLIYGFPFPPVFALDEGDENLWLLDGKQRLNAALEYVQGAYRLHDNTPDVEGVEIKGMFFSELPEDFQDDIRTATFDVMIFRGLSEEDRDQIFYRLNLGEKLSNVELNRVLAGSVVMDFVKELAKEHFFSQAAFLAASSKNRFVDEELILQITALLYNGGEAVSFNNKTMKEFVKKLNEDVISEDIEGGIEDTKRGISEHIEDVMTKTTHYLNEAFPVRDKMLKKVHIPMIFIQATKAMEMGIEPVKFAGWLQGFMNDMPSQYSSASTGGTTKIENIQTRLRHMGEHFDKNVKRAKLYVAPQDQPKSTRGRKKEEPVTA